MLAHLPISLGGLDFLLLIKKNRTLRESTSLPWLLGKNPGNEVERERDRLIQRQKQTELK